VTDPSPRPRYAVYFALPQQSPLWQAAQTWLGRDCESGAALTQPLPEGWTAEEIAAVTESPRRYGFHATLKAPFDLAEGAGPSDLHRAVSAFAGQQQPFSVPPLKVSAIGPFLALTLSAPCPEMETLAAAAVTELDPLRAPLGEADLQRHLESRLSPRQKELLRSWGYPYVMEEFRFHMTLTGPIADEEVRESLRHLLSDHFRPLLAEAVPVREICLYSQEARDQPFLLRERFRLGTGTAEPAGRASIGENRIPT